MVRHLAYRLISIGMTLIAYLLETCFTTCAALQLGPTAVGERSDPPNSVVCRFRTVRTHHHASDDVALERIVNLVLARFKKCGALVRVVCLCESSVTTFDRHTLGAHS